MTDELRPERLARHYSRFRVSERLLLSGHSHQAWPDVAVEGQLEAFADAAFEVDEKWERALERAELVRDGYRDLLGEPAAEIALGASTHELLVRLVSAFDRGRRRVVTTDGEFHTLRRQLARLEEEGLEVVRESCEDADSLTERLSARTDDRTLAVLVSAVLFESARIVPGLDRLAARCVQLGVPFVVDAYHALGAIPFRLAEQGLESAYVVGGGYKYLQLGEGNAFLRLPAGSALRPAITGWFAEFDALASAARPGQVAFAPGAAALAGATYDPTSHYRAARVFEFFREQGLDDERLRRISRAQVDRLARRFDELDLPEDVLTRDRATPLERFGGFLALSGPRAGELAAALRGRGVLCDARAERLRLGPAPYVTDTQIDRAVGILGEIAGE